MRHCRTCVCGVPAPLVVDVHAPFYALVVLIDRITYDEGRRTNRKAAA